MSNSCQKLFRIILFSLLLIFSSLLNTQTIRAQGACGNGNCQGTENCSTCPADCGVCPTSTPTPTLTPTPTPTSGIPTSTPTPVPGAPTPTPTSSSSSSSSSSTSSTSPTTSTTYYPSVTLSTYAPNPTNKVPLTFSGTAVIEKGTIAFVEYTLTDGASWIQVSSSDGIFNQEKENFTFTTPLLTEGIYTVKVRAKSHDNVYTQSDSYASQTVTIALQPPQVTLDAITPNPTNNQTPTFTGTVTAKFAAISRVEVSIDDGKSWKPARRSFNSFSLLVTPLEDDNYLVRARAIDRAGNVGQSNLQTLVIDTIPPLVGGSELSLGPHILVPSQGEIIHLATNTTVNLALSMKGGTTEAYVLYKYTRFPLKKIAGTHLWKTDLQFDRQDEGPLRVIAIDGAGNQTERDIGGILTENTGIVHEKITGNPIEDAQVSLYVYSFRTKSWSLWDAQTFGQKNPQTTNELGTYNFMIPPGRYYVEGKARGFQNLQSEIIDLTKPLTILNVRLPMTRRRTLTFSVPFFGKKTVTLFTFAPKVIPISFPSQIETTGAYTLLPGTKLPEFSLPDLGGSILSSSGFRGRKLVLTFFAPWSQASLEQMSILEKLTQELQEDQSILGISLQESATTTRAILERGKYMFPLVIDRNGDTAASYKITVLPQHFFVDSGGFIQEVASGFFSKEELVAKLNMLQ